MGITIIAFILFIITFIGINIIHKVETDKIFTPWSLLSVLWLLIILFGCFAVVSTGEVAIKTRFGKIVDTRLAEGIHFKLPYEKIQKINIKVQKYENEQALETSTKDMQIVSNIKVSINYQVQGDEVVNLYRKVGLKYKETVLEPAIQETVKAIISKYTAEELVTKRSEIALDMTNTLNEKMGSYGITAVSTAINNFDFSQAYNDAIEKKAVAEQEVETSKNQLEKAKIDAETKKVKAQGDAEANKLLEKSLSEEILQQQFIEKWDGHLPTVTGGSGAILDISKMIK